MTLLDQLLDLVEPRKRELTLDVAGYSREAKDRIVSTAQARGLHAAGDGSWLLIRDLRTV